MPIESAGLGRHYSCVLYNSLSFPITACKKGRNFLLTGWQWPPSWTIATLNVEMVVDVTCNITGVWIVPKGNGSEPTHSMSACLLCCVSGGTYYKEKATFNCANNDLMLHVCSIGCCSTLSKLRFEFRNALDQDDTRVLIWENNLPVPNTGTLDEFINSDGSGFDYAPDFYDPTGNNTPPSATALHRIDHYVSVKNIEDPKLDISMVINKVIFDIKTQTLYYINRNGVCMKLGPKRGNIF